MSCREEVKRIIVKTSTVSGQKPTVPPNEDHRSGLWSVTDIYKGELFFNIPDGKMYTRSDNGIEKVKTDSGSGEILYVAELTQEGTTAPTANVLVNNTGGTVVWSRVDAGEYRGTLAEAFTGSVEVIVTQPNQSGYVTARIPKIAGGDYILLETSTDGDLQGEGISYIEVKKYV